MSGERAFSVRICNWSEAAAALRAIRYAVFVVEQGVPEVLEWDAADASSVHAVAEAATGAPIGCARLLDDGHIGRVAVVAAWRRRGVGRALMRRLIDVARARGDRSLIVNAQSAAMQFYAGEGFVATGDEFEEAGISHRVMTRALR
jgi:predicted GNAT family N-acyltransferase